MCGGAGITPSVSRGAALRGVSLPEPTWFAFTERTDFLGGRALLLLLLFWTGGRAQRGGFRGRRGGAQPFSPFP